MEISESNQEGTLKLALSKTNYIYFFTNMHIHMLPPDVDVNMNKNEFISIDMLKFELL